MAMLAIARYCIDMGIQKQLQSNAFVLRETTTCSMGWSSDIF
jgi:hypothetical protein